MNKYIYVAGFVAAGLVVIFTAGGPGTLLTAPILFVVYVAGHYALGQRTIEANAHELPIRSGGSHGRILNVAKTSDITLVRSRHCRLDTAGTSVWFNRRDWDKLATTVGGSPAL